MPTIFAADGAHSAVMSIESKAFRAEDRGFEVAGEIVLDLDSIGDSSSSTKTVDMLRFGINSKGRDWSTTPAGDLSAVSCRREKVQLTALPDGSHLTLQADFDTKVFYTALEERTGLERIAEDVYASRYEAFKCRWNGIVTRVRSDLAQFTGSLRLEHQHGGLGLVPVIDLLLEGVPIQFLAGKGTCSTSSIERKLILDPIGFRAGSNDDHSAQSWERQIRAAKAVWNKCCLHLDVDESDLRILKDPARKTCNDVTNIAKRKDGATGIRVYFVDADLAGGGASAFQPGMAHGYIVMTDRNNGNRYLLAHEIGHILNGDHPGGGEGRWKLWAGEADSILEFTGSASSANPSKNTLTNCCQVCNSGLTTGQSCRMTPDT